MARVKLEGVRKVYGDGAMHVAVHGIDLEVADGEFVVLVGPSGCGKSTTLRMIAGLESISAGRLLIGDRVVNDMPPKDRDIAMVFQNYALYPHMSVRENMAFALTLRKLSRADIDARVHEAARILGLKGVLDRKPRQLSGGQRQRVAVGRAIVRKPQVFLFDEPLSNLDAKLRVQMRREIARLHRELRATMIYVTHDQVEAMTLGDRIVVMNEGHVQQIDTPLVLYARPANRFVAGFIGSPAMNFIPGVLEAEGGGMRFVSASSNGDRFAIAPDAAIARSLGAHAGKRVILGVRPEDMSLGASANGAISARLEFVEQMGNEEFVHAQAGTHELTARIPPQRLPEPGGAIALAPDPAKLHFFDADTEQRIA